MDAEMEWELAKSGEPIDHPSLLFRTIDAALRESPGSIERHNRMLDVQALLAPQRAIDPDGKYEAEVREAAELRDKEILNGKDPDEAALEYQNRWLESIMRLMKRAGKLGEDWVRG